MRIRSLLLALATTAAAGGSALAQEKSVPSEAAAPAPSPAAQGSKPTDDFSFLDEVMVKDPAAPAADSAGATAPEPVEASANVPSPVGEQPAPVAPGAQAAPAAGQQPAPLDVIPVKTAETPPPAPLKEPPSGRVIEEIVVTAQKRSESLQDVPVAVTAFTSESRQLMGINTVQDFARFTPGLTYSGGTDRIFIRGVGRQTNTMGTDPGVATYADGIYDSSSIGLSGGDFFTERIEVLRGPQGTLYGRNSLGGAINSISKRPTQAFSAEARTTIGNYGTRNFEGMVSGPVSERTKLKIGAAQALQSEGYFKNLAGGPSVGGVDDADYAEAQLDIALSERINNWTKISFAQADRRPRSANTIDPYDYGSFPTGFLTPGAAYGFTTNGFTQLGSQTTNPGERDVWNISNDVTNRARVKDLVSITNETLWELEPFDVKLITGGRGYKYTSVEDFDGTSVTSYTYPCITPGACLEVFPTLEFHYMEDRKFGSAELNLSSNHSGAFQWIGGLYYYRESAEQSARATAPDQPQLRNPVNSDLLSAAPPNPEGHFVNSNSTLDGDSYAAFGQIDYDLTEQWRLTAGLRYSYDKKDATEALRVVCLGCVLPPDLLGAASPGIDVTAVGVSMDPAPGVASPVTFDPETGLYGRRLEGSWSATTGTLGIQWRPEGSDQTMMFARYGRGYKSGGFNAGGLTARPESKPEFVDALEAGLKHTFSSQLQLNVSAYYYNYTDMQVPLPTLSPTGSQATEFYNLDKATSYGLEFETIWQVTDPLQLMFNYAYADSEIEACCFIDVADVDANEPGAQPVGAPGAARAQSLDGNKLSHLPRHKLASSANYAFLLSKGSLVFSANYTWMDKTYYNVFTRPYYQAPSYGTADFRILWTPSDERYRIIGFIRNLTDEVGYDNATAAAYSELPQSGRTVQRSYGLVPPRTYGLQILYRFE